MNLVPNDSIARWRTIFFFYTNNCQEEKRITFPTFLDDSERKQLRFSHSCQERTLILFIILFSLLITSPWVGRCYTLRVAVLYNPGHISACVFPRSIKTIGLGTTFTPICRTQGCPPLCVCVCECVSVSVCLLRYYFVLSGDEHRL